MDDTYQGQDTYRAIKCPLCEYTTGISKWSSWGEENARGALVIHLCRKKHALLRADARELAKTVGIVSVPKTW